jgi:predicted phage tail protein
MFNKINQCLGGAVNICTAFFVIIYLVAWSCNAIYALKFDLGALQSMYLTVIMPMLLKHGTDSIYNSNKGDMPK